MKLRNKLIVMSFIGLTAVSCEKDDPKDPVVEYRNEVEVRNENQVDIEAFMSTHFYQLENNPLNPNYKLITFDTIAGANAGKTSIMDSPYLKTKQVVNYYMNSKQKKDSVVYSMYYLLLREGAPTEPKTTFADEVLVSYRGQTMDLSIFDENTSMASFVLPGTYGEGGVIKGFREILTEFRGASSFTANPDGTLTISDDFGYGVVFIPSGLGYFAEPPAGSGIGSYKSIIFSFQLYKTIQADNDKDGIPNLYEDLNNDKNLTNDNSDADNLPDLADADDDNDGTPTADEIVVNDANGDGYIEKSEITFTDSDNDGTPDYRDPKVK